MRHNYGGGDARATLPKSVLDRVRILLEIVVGNFV
jgi:hypothetical protein